MHIWIIKEKKKEVLLKFYRISKFYRLYHKGLDSLLLNLGYEFWDTIPEALANLRMTHIFCFSSENFCILCTPGQLEVKINWSKRRMEIIKK
jgi:hypothetical protein